MLPFSKRTTTAAAVFSCLAAARNAICLAPVTTTAEAIQKGALSASYNSLLSIYQSIAPTVGVTTCPILDCMIQSAAVAINLLYVQVQAIVQVPGTAGAWARIQATVASAVTLMNSVLVVANKCMDYILVDGVVVKNPNLIAGTNMTIGISGNGVIFASAGVPGPTGPTGPAGAPGSSNVPWFDIQNYGGIPKSYTYASENTTATTTGGSPNVTIGAAKHFVNGEGVCIWEAGAATPLTTAPTAPTVTAPNVQGGQTVKYKIVAFDALGGLSPTSLSAQVTNAPAVFGPIAQSISSISQSSNVVTVNFTNPLNTTVVAGMTLHIKGFTITGDKIFNGVWTLASAPTTSQVTFALSGNYGSGTVSAGVTTGRLSNAQLITAISRSASGLLTITTAESNNSLPTGSNKPTIVIVENCYPESINGQFVVASASGTTLTAQTGNYTAVTGAVVANGDTTLGSPTSASTATVCEYIEVVCPTLAANDTLNSTASPTTCGYFIYSDWGSGGTLNLIGKTVGGNSPSTGNYHFQDWGPYQAGGFAAPAYVPTTPPSSAQNQMWTGFISSGAGTTSLVMTTNVTSSVTGGQIQHDDGPALIAAFNAATSSTETAAVLLSPPTATTINPEYVFNSPISLPNYKNLLIGCAMVCNETLSFGTSSQVEVIPSAVNTINPSFGQRNYALVSGLGCPMFAGNYSFSLDGVCFDIQNNGQYGLVVSGPYSIVSNCSAVANNLGTAVGLIYQNATNAVIENLNTLGASPQGDQSVVGQSQFGPPIGMVWFRTTDNPNLNLVPPAQVVLCGANTLSARGILFDSFGANVGLGTIFSLGDVTWDQAATTPTFMFWGFAFSDVAISGVVNDSSQAAVIANWTALSLSSVSLKNGVNAGDWPLVTGNPIIGLKVDGVVDSHQTVNVVQGITGIANIGQLNNPPPNASKTLHAQPLELGTNGVLFSTLKVVGLTAQVNNSPSGNFAAEAWTVQVSCVGWDGGESELSDAVTVNPNGSQSISGSWTAVSGIKGYNVYLRGFRQNGSPLTTNSFSYTSFSNDGANPTFGASGQLVVSPANGGTVVAQNIVVPSSGYNATTIAGQTLTANRTVTLLDASGTIPLLVSAPSTASSTGIAGQIAYDSTHIYVCVSANTWVRATLATF